MNADINLISYNGPHDNGRTVDLSGRPPLVPTPSIADTLKFSTQLTDFTGIFPAVTSGREDCIDINNRCRNVSITCAKLIFCGRMGVTIKGGSGDILIRFLDATGHGRECDIDIGNWSDQSHEPVRSVVLDCRRLDGEATVVRCLNGDRPRHAPGSGPYRYVFPWPWMPRCIVAPTFRTIRRMGGFR
jgi:hypothetical protein